MIIDANGAIVGRLSAAAAKAALEGQDVVLLNVKTAVISGDPDKIIERYSKRRGMQNKANPDESPKWPRRADLLLKRVIKGMLPKHSARGKAALRRIKAYLGTPEGLNGKAVAFPRTADQLTCRYITLEELCKNI